MQVSGFYVTGLSLILKNLSPWSHASMKTRKEMQNCSLLFSTRVPETMNCVSTVSHQESPCVFLRQRRCRVASNFPRQSSRSARARRESAVLHSAERRQAFMYLISATAALFWQLKWTSSLVSKTYSHSPVGRDSSVGIATRHELDSPGIETRWGRYSAPVQTGPGAHPASYTVVLPGVKRPGRGVNHSPPSSADVKERVELYLHSPSGPSWPVLGRISLQPLPGLGNTRLT